LGAAMVSKACAGSEDRERGLDRSVAGGGVASGRILRV